MIYQTCGLYKVWQSLYNINRPCMFYQICEKLPFFWTLYGLIELQTLCNIDQPCKKNICSCENDQPFGLYKVWQPLQNIYRPCMVFQTCGLYNVCQSLYNIDRPCMIYQTCEKLLAFWTLYDLIELQTLYHTIRTHGLVQLL